MFPATSTPVVEKESRKDGTFAGALEPSHANGQGARGETLVNGVPVAGKWRGLLPAGSTVEQRTPGGGGHGTP